MCGFQRGDKGCGGQLTIARPKCSRLSGVKDAAVEDEGELVVPRAVRGDPVDDQEAVEGDVEA
jgi:hypothetical protein